jgi:nucleoside-diphosphate-sugar epimerase
MQVAVTGISGYLGQVLLPLLEKDPDVESIVGIDVSEPPASPKLRFVKTDVRSPAIKEELQGCDALIHLAFIVMPIRSEGETDSINVFGTKNVLRAAADLGIRKIVYTSSVAAYGAWPDNPPLIKEDWYIRPMPDFYYARTKAIIENWLDGFEREHPDLGLVRLRPCIFLGPRINNVMLELVSGKAMVSFKGISSGMQFVWDEDVADAIMLALKKEVRGAFNLGGEGQMTLEDLAREMQKKVIYMPYGLALAAVRWMWKAGVAKQLHPGWVEIFRYPAIMDTTKAREQLGWEPKLNTREAFRAFIRSL